MALSSLTVLLSDPSTVPPELGHYLMRRLLDPWVEDGDGWTNELRYACDQIYLGTDYLQRMELGHRGGQCYAPTEHRPPKEDFISRF